MPRDNYLYATRESRDTLYSVSLLLLAAYIPLTK